MNAQNLNVERLSGGFQPPFVAYAKAAAAVAPPLWRAEEDCRTSPRPGGGSGLPFRIKGGTLNGEESQNVNIKQPTSNIERGILRDRMGIAGSKDVPSQETVYRLVPPSTA